MDSMLVGKMSSVLCSLTPRQVWAAIAESETSGSVAIALLFFPIQKLCKFVNRIDDKSELTVAVHWWAIPVSSAFKHLDFVLVRQQQGDIIFVITIMDSCVSESSGQMVLLPVVVPVSVLVGTESEHTDLEQTGNKTTMSQTQ